MEELISVIVPIHNAEKYLVNCIESIIKQSYKNLEIILVNDCSNDSSTGICDSYALKDSRIKVIHRKEKGGEGGAKARNNGFAESRGSVIYFMDSDDYIEESMLWNMYQIMKEDQCQCVVSSFHYVDSEGNELPWRTPQLEEYKCMKGKEAAAIFLTTLNIEGFSWNKLIRRELMEEKEICFDESMNSFVDMYNMFKTVLYSSKVGFYHEKPYYYRQHNVSCVHTMTKRKLDNFKRVIGQISRLAEEYGLEQEGNFFQKYRMTLQLFDAVKAKKEYDPLIWRQIQEEYQWKNIFKGSLCKTYKTIFYYWKEDQIKTMIKILLVWINFNRRV